MATQRQSQQDQLSALSTELSDSLTNAQTHIKQLLPSHKQDMALVELLAQHVEGARKKVAAQLQQNCRAAGRIEESLQQLRDHISKAGGVQAMGQPAVGVPGGQDLGAGCHGLLSCVDTLRRQLLQQGQVCSVRLSLPEAVGCGRQPWLQLSQAQCCCKMLAPRVTHLSCAQHAV